MSRRYTEEQLAFIRKNRKLSRAEIARRFSEKYFPVSEGMMKSLCQNRGWTTGRVNKPLAISSKQAAWLEKRAADPRKEVTLDFNARFGTNMTPGQISGYMLRKGWSTGVERRPNIPWSDEEIDFLYQHRELEGKQRFAKFQDKFNRPDVDVEDLKRAALARGIKTGRTGHFPKGHTPANKGMKGYYAPGCEKTWFKSGNAPANAKPVGYERICGKDGYVLIMIDEENPYTGADRRLVHKHRWAWEKANGDVPEGYQLKCWDGNITNCDPDNWFLITRAEQAVLNRQYSDVFYSLPTREEKESLMQAIRLKLKIGQLERAAKNKETTGS